MGIENIARKKVEVEIVMKYSLLLCRGEWQDIHAGLTFFSLEHEFCTISSAGEKILQRFPNVFLKHYCGVKLCIHQGKPVVVSARV